MSRDTSTTTRRGRRSEQPRGSFTPQRVMSTPVDQGLRSSMAISSAGTMTENRRASFMPPGNSHALLSPIQQRHLHGNAIYNAMHPATDGDADELHHPHDHGEADTILDIHTASMRRAARELLVGAGPKRRSRNSIVDLRYGTRTSGILLGRPAAHASGEGLLDATDTVNYGATVIEAGEDKPLLSGKPTKSSDKPMDAAGHSGTSSPQDMISHVIQQTSAVIVVALLNIMMGIPFGVSYFPIGWKATDGDGADGDDFDDDVSGAFPLPAKQALGIRMFLFATIIAQLVFTFASRFENAIGLQMVENIPFLHALCENVIKHQGYGIEALSTVFFLFAFSSVIVGATFYLLGKLNLGKIVYYFPNHVLVGCIGGIGVFIVVTGIEVTTDVPFTFDLDGLASIADNFNLVSVVLAFEITLRILQYVTQDKDGNAKFPLLKPVFYCMIAPIFYLCLWIFGVSKETATDMGYFFPPLTDADGGEGTTAAASFGLFSDPHLWDIFKIINFSTISWAAVVESTGTIIALTAFSLIHVPINIPAFAISTDVDTDMNQELIAHGYSNALSGIFGGLQTYMAYSNSVLYASSGGRGRVSSFGVVFVLILLFLVGPSIASYLPRCMAGTLLLHVGLDLFLEGVYDSYGDYDNVEYAGIWIITLVMTMWGMTASLIAGLISALTTYAVQSINYQNPIRQVLTASTLRSSAWTRCKASRNILENDAQGRARILIFQLQGHLFFGNIAQLTDTIKDLLKKKKEFGEPPIVVIVDFTLVVGMDSSAAHAVAKLKKIIHRLFNVEVSIFVTGSDRDGFPCEFALSEALSPEAADSVAEAGLDLNDITGYLRDSYVSRGSISVSPGTSSERATKKLSLSSDGRVYETLDDALRFAEDILIAREDVSLVVTSSTISKESKDDFASKTLMASEEAALGKEFLKDLFPSSDDLHNIIETLWGAMKRETVTENDAIWQFGMESDSMKILVSGELLSIIEDTGASEVVMRGNFIGEFGLVHETRRLTTLMCTSKEAILYSLDKKDFERLKKDQPEVAMAIYRLAIRYLAHRVQHVSNRYFHTTLPI